MVIAVLTLSRISKPESKYPILLYIRFQRAINFALLIYVLIIALFLFWYPVPLGRNAVVHTVVFSVNFFSEGGLSATLSAAPRP
jgi:hypothetical protein